MRRVLSVALVLASLHEVALADDPIANPDNTADVVTTEQADNVRWWSDDVRPLKKSYAIPFVESVGFIAALNASAQLAGMDWAEISLSTMHDNLTGSWVWDEDPFTIDQVGHPYTGAWPFLAARSTGHGFWTSAVYSIGSSLVWELLMENEPPSINDQITTPIAGSLIGESLHRMGRALRVGNPGPIRTAAATLIDPVGSLNREVWGKAWRDKLPPSFYAHVGIGWEQQTRLYEGARVENDQNAFHSELVLQHGLPGDPDFAPRRPLDHFDLRGSLDVSSEHVIAQVDIRGLVWGRKFDTDGARGLWGLYGTYDYMNPDRVRASAIGVGPGAVVELPIGEQDFFRATGVAMLVPWGAAGGSNEAEGEMRDYHRGPGAAQIVELELGRRNLGGLRLTSRAWEIDGRYVGDGEEFVTTHTLGGRLALARNHAVGVEGTYALRAATFTPDTMDRFDRAIDFRIFYALTTGRN
ncbi:MAG TPA: DUF3943 domain-containing protein [Kofleriaceae bacterium]|nr:DUF3943 domain-containing protein [Kofleriaceae bacterium]